MDEPTDWSGQKKQLYVLGILVALVFIIYEGRQIWLRARGTTPVPAASPASGTH